MPEKPDSRVRKTRALLRRALAELMQQKSVNEITVKELVECAGINRSTFYLHYADIETMLCSIEDELLQSIEQSLRTHPIDPYRAEIFPVVEELFALLEENREIAGALLGPHGDIGFLHRIEQVMAAYSLQVLLGAYPEHENELRVAYAFCLSGCVGIIKAWLGAPERFDPQSMSAQIYRLIHNAMQGITWGAPPQ